MATEGPLTILQAYPQELYQVLTEKIWENPITLLAAKGKNNYKIFQSILFFLKRLTFRDYYFTKA